MSFSDLADKVLLRAEVPEPARTGSLARVVGAHH